MDDTNWRPMQESNPAAGVDPNAPAEGDWRAQLQPEARSRVVGKILEHMKRHLPVSEPEGLNELQRIAVRLEDKSYATATNQSDYLRKISLKILVMETQTQHAPRNVIPNQNNPGQASASSTAQTSHPGADDWQEEIYQKIKSLKDQHFAELSELFNQISVKIQRVDSIIPPQKPSELYNTEDI